MKVWSADEVGGEATEVDIPDDQFEVVTHLLNKTYVQAAGHVLVALQVVNQLGGEGLEERQIQAEMLGPDFETLVVKGIFGQDKTFILATGPGARAAVEAWLAREFGEGEEEGEEEEDEDGKD